MATKERNVLVASEELNGGVVEDRTSAPQLLMSELGGANTLDKVRDILFGGQAREFERHFSRMEDRLAKMASELREDLRKGLDALETYVKREFDTLHERIRAEATERGVAVKTLTQELHAASDAATQKLQQLEDQTNKQLRAESTERGAAVKAVSQDLQVAGNAMTQKLQQFDEQTTKQFREVRAQLLEQARTQSEDLRQKYTELTAALEHAIQELRSNKTDRAGLAALFTEAAVRLQNEFRLPGND